VRIEMRQVVQGRLGDEPATYRGGETLAPGSAFAFSPGQVVDVSDDLGEALVSTGRAVAHDAPAPAAPTAAPAADKETR
jgi:hypothetical protein